MLNLFLNEVKVMMDWSKYNIDGWLQQLSIYYNDNRMVGGHRPDDLSQNSLYRLIASSDPSYSKVKVTCHRGSTDEEVNAIQDVLRKFLNDERYTDEAKRNVRMLIANKVEGKSTGAISNIYGTSPTSVKEAIKCAKYLIHGLYPTLKP